MRRGFTFGRWLLVSLVLVGVLGYRPPRASALILTHTGNDPVTDMGWPQGALAVANMLTRVGYYEGPPFGGGQYVFQYHAATTQDFNDALKVFSHIAAPRLELVISDGACRDIKVVDTRVDWECELWVPENYYRYVKLTRELSGAAAQSSGGYAAFPAPRITVYCGEGSPIDWAGVAIPLNLTVIDKRVSSSEYKGSTGGVFKVTVYDAATGKILPDATVSLTRLDPAGGPRDYSATTDKSGTAVIRDIAACGYKVSISYPAYATRTLTDGYYNAGHTLEAQTVALAKAASLNGTVLDPEGHPLSGATVETRSVQSTDFTGYAHEAGSAVTDKKGWFEIGGLPHGQVGDLIAHKEGYTAAEGKFPVPGDSVKLTVDYAAVIRGRVKGVDPKAEPGQVGVRMEVPGGPRIGSYGGGMNVGADGKFEFTGVPKGTYVFSVYGMQGVEPKTVEVKPTKPGQVYEVELK